MELFDYREPEDGPGRADHIYVGSKHNFVHCDLLDALEARAEQMVREARVGWISIADHGDLVDRCRQHISALGADISDFPVPKEAFEMARGNLEALDNILTEARNQSLKALNAEGHSHSEERTQSVHADEGSGGYE